MQGVNLTFPFLERRQAVFVDFVIFGTTVSDRRTTMMSFLCEHGHFVEEVKNGTETLLKIDNIFYRIVPKTVSCQGIPVQGALLSPVYRWRGAYKICPDGEQWKRFLLQTMFP